MLKTDTTVEADTTVEDRTQSTSQDINGNKHSHKTVTTIATVT